MLPSPISVTIAGIAHSLNRINQDDFGSVYLKKTTGAEIRLAIRHTYEKIVPGRPQYERHNVDLSITTFSDNPAIPPVTDQVYVVLRSRRGAAVESIDNVLKALNAFTNTNGVSIAGWAS